MPTAAKAARTLDVPQWGMQFSARMEVQASADGSKERRFSGVAYAGGLITDHPYWSAVAFDLAGLKAEAPMPVLLQHDHGAVIGVIDQVTNDGQRLLIGGKLFTGIDPRADEVAAKADAGAPWQMSVGIFPSRVEEMAPGESRVINGRTVSQPATIFATSRVRETSFVALGADGDTRATVFAGQAGATTRLEVFTAEGAPAMSETISKADHEAAIAEAVKGHKAAAEAALAKVAELEGKFAAQTKAARESALKTLLGDKFTAETAAPYLGMTDEQFSAVEKTLRAIAPKLPADMTTEFATNGRTPGAGKVTPEGIAKYRRDNPGATFEAAFAALTSSAA